jgi:ACS family hexuronate transporter-like MFS transporter
MFFFTGALGLLWAVWWWFTYRTPTTAPAAGRDATDAEDGPAPTLPMLLARGEVVSVAAAKFLTDAAWYFYIFWLPKYLFDAWNLDLKAAASIGWIPYAAAGVGCLVGGYFSGWLLKRGRSVNFSRKAALGLSAAMMPWVMLVPVMPNVGLVMVLFSLAFFGQQSWSTLVMTLPTDMVPRGSLGKFAGLVGMGGAFGGVVMGTVAGWMLDHGFSYTPVLVIAGSLHLLAFGLICVAIPNLQRLVFAKKA